MKKTFKFSILALLIAALTASMLMVSASAAYGRTAEQQKEAEERSTLIQSERQYKTEYSISGERHYYKISVSKNGQLKLYVNIDFKKIGIGLGDEKGKYIAPSGAEAETGSVNYGHDTVGLSWNPLVESGNGLFVYEVEKGDYYLEFYYHDSGKLNFTADFPSDDTPATKSIRLKITLNEGDTLRLGAVIDPEDAEEPKWTSSNKEVATVSKSGKITAVSAGTATIKCKSGGKTLKIKLVVETA